MSRPVHLSKEAFTRSLWKNGLGHTDQIAIEPENADLRKGNYLWRISSASITSASDFSLFPDHDRALVILSGAGVKLTHKDEENGFDDTVELPPLEPYEFPGDIRSRCELIDGPVKDFSVFFRKGEVSATIDVRKFDEDTVWQWEPRASASFIFAVRGGFEVATSEDATETLSEGDAIRMDAGGEEDFFPVVPHSGGSVLLSISLWKA